MSHKSQRLLAVLITAYHNHFYVKYEWRKISWISTLCSTATVGFYVKLIMVLFSFLVTGTQCHNSRIFREVNFDGFSVKIESQCGNFTIFLSIRFYVRSILGNRKVPNLPSLTHLRALNYDFYGFLHFLNAKIDQTNTIKSLRNGTNGIFRTSRSPKIDFT